MFLSIAKSCHTCQMTGTLNQTKPKGDLQPIPAFYKPFSRIIVDCVGPLPKTKSGCEYHLTIICASTLFPEGIPLRNIKTKRIVKTPVKFFLIFLFVGLPQVYSFWSRLKCYVWNFSTSYAWTRHYSVSVVSVSPWKAMWPETISLTIEKHVQILLLSHWKRLGWRHLFALICVREFVQGFLDLSPLELIFGHTVRGPLILLKIALEWWHSLKLTFVYVWFQESTLISLWSSSGLFFSQIKEK